MNEVLEGAYEGEFYRWSCPCGDVHDTEADPRGDTIECGTCGESVAVPR